MHRIAFILIFTPFIWNLKATSQTGLKLYKIGPLSVGISFELEHCNHRKSNSGLKGK